MDIINNRYTVIETLGHGSMGTVYHVHDTLNDNRSVALKLISPHCIQGDMEQTLKNEFHILTHLKHPHLVEVHDYFTDAKASTFITMEYLSEGSLQDKIDTQTAYTHSDIAHIASELCQALEFIHAKGYIHRDIKPANILIKNTSVKVTDFGLSNLAHNSTDITGTVGYLAPETLHEEISAQCDIFSLGITLFEITEHHSFYEGLSSKEIVHLLYHEDDFTQFIDKKLHHISDEQYRSVLSKTLCFDQKSRYNNTPELLLDLQKTFTEPLAIETADTKNAYIHSADFVGRDDEFTLLKKSISRKEKNPHALWVEGEAGIGKSRLLYECKKFSQVQGIHFFEGSCYEDVKYYLAPFISIFSDMMTYASQNLLNTYGSSLIKLFPHYEFSEEIEPIEMDDPQEEKNHLLNEYRNFIIDLSEFINKPIVIYCNDLQWSDDGTSELLSRLVSTLDDSHRITILMSSRPEGKEFLKTISSENSGVHTIPLTPFDRDKSVSYIHSLFGEHRIGKSFYREIPTICNHAKGNPLYLQEIIKHFIHSHIIIRNNLLWEISQPLSEELLPPRIEDLLIKKLELLDLSEEESRCLTIIAFIQRDVSHRELETICTTPIKLRKCISEGIILSHNSPEDMIYSVSHNLISKTIYNQCGHQEEIHYIIACGMEKYYPEKNNRIIEELGVHFFKSKNNSVKAQKYLTLAAMNAEKTYENRKAIVYLDNLLNTFDTKFCTECVKALMSKYTILNLLNNTKESYEASTEAILCALEIKDYRSVAQAHLFSAESMIMNNDHSNAGVNHLQKALEYYQKIDSQEGVSETLNWFGAYYAFMCGDYDKSIDYYLQGIEAAEKCSSELMLAYNLANLSYSYQGLSQFDKSIEIGKKALILFKKLDLPRDYYNTLSQLGFTYHCIVELDKSLKYLNEVIDESAKMEYVHGRLASIEKKVHLLLSMGLYNEATELYEEELEQTSYFDIEKSPFKKILHTKIIVAKGDREKAINELLLYREKMTNKYNRGIITHELWRQTGEELYRREGLALCSTLEKNSKEFVRGEHYDLFFREFTTNNVTDPFYSKIGTSQSEKQFLETASYEAVFLLNQIKKIDRSIHSSIQDNGFIPVQKITEQLQNLKQSIYTVSSEQKRKKRIGTDLKKNPLLQEILSMIEDLNCNIDLESILSKILDLPISFLNADRGAVLLLNEKDSFTMRLARNNNKESIPYFPISSNIGNKVKTEGKNIFIADVLNQDEVDVQSSILDMKLRSIMAVPLLDKQESTGEIELLGMIYLDSHETTKSSAFTKDNLSVLTTLADHASVAIKNAIMKEALIKSNESLQEIIVQKNDIAENLLKEVEVRKKAEQRVQEINEHLEELVTERTAELKQTQQKLVDTAYKAGMAEIATDIIHNVGNVLTNVSTTCYLLDNSISQSKLFKLEKANEMLVQHKDNLEDFILHNPRGKKLLNYYFELGKLLQAERHTETSLVQKLRSKINLITEILKTQQKHTQKTELESVNIVELLEETLEMYNLAFTKGNIILEKNYAKAVTVKGHKIKILQIFEHIIKNALESIDLKKRASHHLSITVSTIENSVNISFTDSGTGIHKDYITRIFSHGFTTKKNRNGFGLHTCANLMKEMGGKISTTAIDDGAIFLLDFQGLS